MAEFVALIPTKNEEEGIGRVINDLKPYTSEIIVIDGSSKDKTVKIAKQLGAKVFRGTGKGKGKDFLEFISRYKINPKTKYIMLDGDASYPATQTKLFLKALDDYEIVSGKRKTIRLKPKNLVHFVGNKIISLLGLLLYGKYMDICTGMWGFRGEILKKLELKAKGFELEANLFINLRKLNLKHKEILIEYFPRVGKEKLREIDGFKIIYFLIKEKLRG